MIALIKKIFSWLFSESESVPATFGNPDLYPINTQLIAKKLDIKEEAKKLGEKNLPNSSETKPTGIEYKIIQTVEKARQEYADWGTQRARILNALISNSDVSSKANIALQLDAEFERKAGALLNDMTPTLSGLKKRIEHCKTEYERFREENQLTNLATYPSPSRVKFLYAVLVALVVLESAFNSYFFALGMWGGLLDGIVIAGLFAFFNVSLAYIYGKKFLPNIFHRNTIRKCAGAILMIASVVAILVLALLIAHYREAVEIGSYESAAKVAWESFKNSPFKLADIHSVILFGFSILCAFSALIDSFLLDDKYPGYGEISRKLDQAAQDFAIEFEDVSKSLDDLKRQTLQELEALVDDMRITIHQLDQAIEQKKDTGLKLRNAFINVDNCMDALLGMFRNENMIYRTTTPPPYFSEAVKLREVALPDFDTQKDLEKYTQQLSKLKNCEERVTDIRSKIQSSFNKFFDSLKPLDEHFSSGAHT